MNWVLRRPARELDVNRRTGQRRFGVDQWNLRTIENVAFRLIALHAEAVRNGEHAEALSIRRRLRLLLRYRKAAMYVIEAPLPVFGGSALRLNAVSTNMQVNTLSYFRFNMAQLGVLYKALQVPDDFRCTSGHVVHGETAFLIGMYRLAVGKPFVLMQEECRMQHTKICRVCNSFNAWLRSSWGYLVRDNLPFFVPRLPAYAEAVREYLAAKYGIEFPPVGDPGGGFNIALFIDCCVFGIGRPGGGPTTGGERWTLLLQEAYFNGWLHKHGLKIQVVYSPDGMIVHASKLYSFRRNDNHLFAETGINTLLREAQNGQELQFAQYGDSIYAWLSHTKSRYEGPDLTPREKRENEVLSGVRTVCAEHTNGILKTQWKMVDCGKKLQLLRGNIPSTVTAALILHNLQNIMHFNEVAQVINKYDNLCKPPSLVQYLAAGPRAIVVADDANDAGGDDDDDV